MARVELRLAGSEVNVFSSGCYNLVLGGRTACLTFTPLHLMIFFTQFRAQL